MQDLPSQCRLASCGNVEARRFICSGAYGISAPRPRMEPASPALQGGFLTTEPPGKSQEELFVVVVRECAKSQAFQADMRKDSLVVNPE